VRIGTGLRAVVMMGLRNEKLDEGLDEGLEKDNVDEDAEELGREEGGRRRWKAENLDPTSVSAAKLYKWSMDTSAKGEMRGAWME